MKMINWGFAKVLYDCLMNTIVDPGPCIVYKRISTCGRNYRLVFNLTQIHGD